MHGCRESLYYIYRPIILIFPFSIKVLEMKGDGGKKRTFVHCLLIKQVKVASNWPLLIHCHSP